VSSGRCVVAVDEADTIDRSVRQLALFRSVAGAVGPR
jgi:hypothetical protein